MSLRANDLAIHLGGLADTGAADDAARDAVGRDVLRALAAIDRAATDAAPPAASVHVSPALAGPGIYDRGPGTGCTTALRAAALDTVMTTPVGDSLRTTARAIQPG